jgi:Sigma-70, region 4
MSQKRPAALTVLHPMLEHRPTKRSECRGGPRPCPWVGCAHNNYIKEIRDGKIIRTVPGSAPEEADPMTSCRLDLQESGGLTLKEVSEAYGVSRERGRQIQNQALDNLRRKPQAQKLRAFLEPDHSPGSDRNEKI